MRNSKNNLKSKPINTEKIIQLPEIGTVKISKSSKAKRLILRIKPLQGVSMVIPLKVSFADAENFLHQKIDWIKTNMPKIQQYEAKQSFFDTHTIYQTKYHQLEITLALVKKPTAQIGNGKITILCPLDTDFKLPENQAFIRKVIEYTLKREAKAYLPKRVAELATQHQFYFKKVSIRNSKTRWGSCSHDNRINLNLHLMRMPVHLSDYVILHELCHTKEKNHQKGFWNLMEKVCKNAKALDKELKNYSINVF